MKTTKAILDEIRELEVQVEQKKRELALKKAEMKNHIFDIIRTTANNQPDIDIHKAGSFLILTDFSQLESWSVFISIWKDCVDDLLDYLFKSQVKDWKRSLRRLLRSTHMNYVELNNEKKTRIDKKFIIAIINNI